MRQKESEAYVTKSLRCSKIPISIQKNAVFMLRVIDCDSTYTIHKYQYIIQLILLTFIQYVQTI